MSNNNNNSANNEELSPTNGQQDNNANLSITQNNDFLKVQGLDIILESANPLKDIKDKE